MKTIEQEWRGFSEFIFQGMDIKEDSTQYIEMKKAFFAGATAMIFNSYRVCDLSDEEAQAQLQAWMDEANAYNDKMIRDCLEKN